MSHSHTQGSDASDRPEGRSDGQGVRRAGAFDIRTFIGSLIGIYGVVLVVVGLVGTSNKQLAKSDDLNINLWAGIGMVVVAAFFLLWARLRPVVIPPHPQDAD